MIFPYSSRNRSSYSLAAASWVTVTVALPCPGAVDSKTAEPVPEESAAMVTFCAVFQFDGVKVSVPPPLTERPEFPLARAVVTVTLAVGCLDSLTSNVPDVPWRTPSWVGEATTVGPEETVMPTGVELADAPRLSYAFATREWLPTARLAAECVKGALVSVASRVVSS
ncbi:hypothetical protein SFUMM280S_05334 [Streptomyces fumanus]